MWGGGFFLLSNKKCWLHPGEISVAWYVTSDQFVQECSVATSLLYLLYQGRTHGFCGFLLLGGGGDGDAGWAGAGFGGLLCVVITTYKNKFNSIKTEGPSSDLSLALDVFLSSLKCEMNGTSQGRGVYIE